MHFSVCFRNIFHMASEKWKDKKSLRLATSIKKMEPKHAYKTKLAWYLKTKEIMIILCTKQKRQGTPHGLWLFYEHLGNYSFN